MKIEELENFVTMENELDLEWQEENGEFFIRSKYYETCIKIDMKKLDRITVQELKKEIVQGKEVINISRVTGFFSITTNWNKGKQGELKERYRVNNGFF